MVSYCTPILFNILTLSTKKSSTNLFPRKRICVQYFNIKLSLEDTKISKT